MSLSLATILPSSYFDGLSTLWGGCAYLGSTIVAAGLVFQIVRSRPDGSTIGSSQSVPDWDQHRLPPRVADASQRRGDGVQRQGWALLDSNGGGRTVRPVHRGKAPTDPDTSVWDIIWGTESIGTAFCYAFLWLFGWMSWGVQYVVKLVGDILLTAGWALSPIFLSFLMLRSMAGVAQKYIVGLVALVFWPFGWVIAAVVTDAMLQAAAVANLMPVIAAGNALAAPALTVLLIGSWVMLSSVLAPWVTTKVLVMG